MIVTGALIAADAAVANGALHVWSGVLDTLQRPDPSVPVTPVLVVLTQAEGDGDSTEVVDLEINGPDGSLQKVELPVPEATRSGTNAGFFFHRIGIAGPDGRYVLVVGSVSLPVEIRTSTQ